MENFQNEIAELKKRIDNLERNQPKDKLSMIVFSGSLDKILAALIVATGASAMGT
ncbi:MAG: NADH dehydrogenase FAD-containing subunit, partial [Candidatus Cloacimonadota bacterium]